MAKRVVRPIRIEGNIAYVPLTKGYEAIIDASDVPLVDGANWCALVGCNTVYARRTDRSGPRVRTILMHRLILDRHGELEIDHRDGNGLNNRRSNLRLANRMQNQQNTQIRMDNTSGIKGVSWHARDSRWRAQIKINGKVTHLGYYITLEAARDAYVNASNRFHGEFGKTT